MPSKSKAHQRFMGMVLAVKRGAKAMSPGVRSAAKSMTLKSVKDFAKTQTTGLPEKIMGAIKKRIKRK